MRLLRTLFLAAGLLAPVAAHAEEVQPLRIQGGYINAYAYLDMYEEQKKAYVAGLLDGMLLAPRFGGDPARAGWLNLCMSGADAGAIRDGITQYLRAHTDQWELRNPAKMYRGVRDTCHQRLEAMELPPPGSEPPAPQRAFDGHTFMALYGKEKRSYVAGLIEGVLLAPAFGGIDARMEWFIACTDGLGLTRMRDEITTWVRLHPERWEGRDPAVMFDAVSDTCRRHLEDGGG